VEVAVRQKTKSVIARLRDCAMISARVAMPLGRLHNRHSAKLALCTISGFCTISTVYCGSERGLTKAGSVESVIRIDGSNNDIVVPNSILSDAPVSEFARRKS
jgi:hypothetical protein